MRGTERDTGRFDGQAAIVTGAGSGIGAAIAAALAAEGAAVVAFDADGEAARRTAGAIAERGGQGLALEGDARSDTDVHAAVDAAVAAFGGLDLLAPVAGVMRVHPTADVDGDEWDLVLATNVKGPFLLTRAALPALRARGGGAIVAATSVMAYASLPGAAAYSASKGAIAALTHALALELAPDGIRVNAIAPGTVRTPMLRRLAAESDPTDVERTMERWGAVHPIGRLVEPVEVARLACFLLSDEASAITGSCHRVDGGLLSRLPA